MPKFLTLLVLICVLPLLIHAQKKLQQSWIKTEIENLSGIPIEPDTLYTRYTFNKSEVNISFNPTWNGTVMQWSYNEPFLTIGLQAYVVEELTDSTLVFYADGFRRFRFVSEAVFKKRQQPDTTSPFNDHTVYIVSKYLSPRIKKVRGAISDKLSEVHTVKKAATFTATFVVTDQGKVDGVKIVNSIAADYDNEFVKQIKKTSGNWVPAKIGNTPVYSLVTFEVMYMDSIADPNFGHIK